MDQIWLVPAPPMDNWSNLDLEILEARPWVSVTILRPFLSSFYSVAGPAVQHRRKVYIETLWSLQYNHNILLLWHLLWWGTISQQQSCSCLWSYLNSFILKGLIQTSIWTTWLWWTAGWVITWYFKQLYLSAKVKEREHVRDLTAPSDLTYRHHRTSLDHHVTGHFFGF